MEISYKNQKERSFYESGDALKSAHGAQMARKIVQRIDELQAACNPQQLPRSARFHEHSGNRKGLFSIDLVHPYRLIVRSTNEYANYIEIVEVEIYEIIDPH